MAAVRESLERIATALERLVALHEREAGGAKAVLSLAERQRREDEGRPAVELVDPENEPGPA